MDARVLLSRNWTAASTGFIDADGTLDSGPVFLKHVGTSCASRGSASPFLLIPAID
jgi:hypothetical protein